MKTMRLSQSEWPLPAHMQKQPTSQRTVLEPQLETQKIVSNILITKSTMRWLIFKSETKASSPILLFLSTPFRRLKWHFAFGLSVLNFALGVIYLILNAAGTFELYFKYPLFISFIVIILYGFVRGFIREMGAVPTSMPPGTKTPASAAAEVFLTAVRVPRLDTRFLFIESSPNFLSNRTALRKSATCFSFDSCRYTGKLVNIICSPRCLNFFADK
jgi:hypothetical protein